MSRRESRDHHGKRPSRFDRGPSPKKVRRDGQPTTERTYSRGRDLDADSAADHDQKHSRRLLDSSPLEVAPPPEKPVQPGTGKKDLDKKADELVDGMKRASYKKEVPRSRGEKEATRSRDEKEVPRSRDGKEVPRFRDEKEVPRPRNEKEVPRPRNEKEVPQLQTYFQHDERDSAGHDGRRSGRKALDHGRWSDSKEQYSERARFKGEARELQRKDERSVSNADDKKVWKHDKFSELEAVVPPLRKRPAFSENKMVAEPETAAAVKVSESTRMPHEIGLEGTRREERGAYQSRGLEKTDRPFSRVDERNGRRGDGHPRPSYEQRERFHGGFTSGREMPNVRSAYRPGGVQVDKWKHDLYAEANRSPTPKNEDDQIAKVEALLAL